MNDMKRRLGPVAVLLFGVAIGWADSIAPSTVTETISKGSSTTINKTVTITHGAVTSSKVDVFFLADTTGSMGGAIASVITSASTILSSTAAAGDVNFAVGEYKDNGDVYVYRLNQAMTANQASAQAGINMWAAAGGGDLPEAYLYGLQQASQDATGWRSGSEKILVWFGDAPGHDPSGPTGVTLAQSIAALQAKNIQVQAIDVGTMDSAGQAT